MNNRAQTHLNTFCQMLLHVLSMYVYQILSVVYIITPSLPQVKIHKPVNILLYTVSWSHSQKQF